MRLCSMEMSSFSRNGQKCVFVVNEPSKSKQAHLVWCLQTHSHLSRVNLWRIIWSLIKEISEKRMSWIVVYLDTIANRILNASWPIKSNACLEKGPIVLPDWSGAEISSNTINSILVCAVLENTNEQRKEWRNTHMCLMNERKSVLILKSDRLSLVSCHITDIKMHTFHTDIKMHAFHTDMKNMHFPHTMSSGKEGEEPLVCSMYRK